MSTTLIGTSTTTVFPFGYFTSTFAVVFPSSFTLGLPSSVYLNVVPSGSPVLFSIKSSGFGVSPFGVTTFFLATGAGTNFPGTTFVEYCAVISVSWVNVPVI